MPLFIWYLASEDTTILMIAWPKSMNYLVMSGMVLLVLGKLQFRLQKIVDGYRAHVVQTITTPSESLLNELRTVEEMKRQ
ncbi:hypothetical protein QJS04_geneDACA020907 [Acorus gramineus]|uniref:Uncharacterized protein n=1 Tax=Acorus gramineus TaxID=55184 RepID=A0AAV9B3K8_ACOGR|nr:hypothetical protein QJS04_geneDACA020907 [Acorus gramineus]